MDSKLIGVIQVDNQKPYVELYCSLYCSGPGTRQSLHHSMLSRRLYFIEYCSTLGKLVVECPIEGNRRYSTKRSLQASRSLSNFCRVCHSAKDLPNAFDCLPSVCGTRQRNSLQQCPDEISFPHGHVFLWTTWPVSQPLNW